MKDRMPTAQDGEKGMHTPTPWIIGKGGSCGIYGDGTRYICGTNVVGPVEENEANAALIVLAVNAYEGMLAALKRIRDAHHECLMGGRCTEKDQLCIPCVTRFAIAKAESV